MRIEREVPFCPDLILSVQSNLTNNGKSIKLFITILFHSIHTQISNNNFDSLRSLAGLVIQGSGRTEFEDGLRPGSPGGVLSDNPSVRTSSLVTPVL